MRGRAGGVAAGALGLLAALVPALAAGAGPEASMVAPLAPRSLMLDLAGVEGRVVAVGERGHVLVSRDEGRTWRQVVVPTRATLTSIVFRGAEGVSVGHDAVILRTEDGGEHFSRVFEAAEQERPLFDVWVRGDGTGIAVGAYGLHLVTADGGRSWAAADVAMAAPPPGSRDAGLADGGDDGGAFSLGDLHLHRLAVAPGGRAFLAAEAGTFLRSDDDARTWTPLSPPYEGSFYGALPLEGAALLLYGLRGHLLRSEDGGRSWEEIPTGTTSMLNDAVDLGGGRIVVVGLGGAVLVSTDGGRTFAPKPRDDRLGRQAVLWPGGGHLVTAGEGGCRLLGLADLGLGGVASPTPSP